MSAPPVPSSPQLVRAIGRWSMVALVINCIVGSGIFGLPSALAGLLGRESPFAVLLAGAGMGVIVACYAEVGSQFTGSGGTYLYLRRTFGRLIGVQVGWMFLLARLTACAASVNLFVAYLAEFWPAATQPFARALVNATFVGTLAAINCRGVGGGVRMSNLAVVAKLLVLGGLCGVGAVWLTLHAPLASPEAAAWPGNWVRATLLLLFAYGGYEAALAPMGEARDPRRDVAFALCVALIVVTALYATLQLLVISTVIDAAHSARPLADVARVLLGRPGAALVACGTLLSIYGYISANLLTMPRTLFALAEHGDFPKVLAAVHPRWRTPYVSIALFALLVWAAAQLASFSWNVTLSAVARVIYYAGICAAVPVLRRTQPQAAAFRLPGGLLLPACGVAICAVLLTGVDFSQSVVVLVTIGIALINWAAVRAQPAPAVHTR